MLIKRKLPVAALCVFLLAVCFNGCATGPKTRPFVGMDPPPPDIRTSVTSPSPAAFAPDKGNPEPKK